MIGNVATKVAALSEEEETSKVHYTSTSSRRILFFKTSFAGVNAAPGRAPDGARRHPSTRGHDVEGCVLLQVADHETNDGMRWTEWNRKKKKCMHHGYNCGQPRRAWTWSKTSGMRLDATSPVCMRQLHRTDDGHNIRRSAGTLFFFLYVGRI